MRQSSGTAFSSASHLLACALLAQVASLTPLPARAFDLPPGFENVEVFDGLHAPASLAFSPDGRMFIGERITGRLLVARKDASDTWVLEPEPFYTFDIPKDPSGDPTRYLSSGLRGFAFDPDFATTRFIYAFYMKHEPRHNRVVRIRASLADPDLADMTFNGSGEELLLDLPFSDTVSSGSHNGGAVAFGPPEPGRKLYVTTGDGWNEADHWDALTSWTGKLLRINKDGTIPTDNAFYSMATGDHRAIQALGFRNPFELALHPVTGTLYVSDANGSSKADVHVVVPGANYRNTFPSIGTYVDNWANAGVAGGDVISGAVWYPPGGPFPSAYHGALFAPLWGSNTGDVGQISYIHSDSDTSVSDFETNVGLPDVLPLLPTSTRVGPDGNLYYLLTTYWTENGRVRMVAPTGFVEQDCGNGVDDDGDMRIDCDDRDCRDRPPCREVDCSDGADEDSDGLTDCADSDCEGAPVCPEVDCDDGLDDDGDGRIDCDDPDCALDPACVSEDCGNGLDDDGDGRVDCDDSDCVGEPVCVETRCDDCLDDDGDGDVDCDDSDCALDPACTVETCDNGVDDNGDGLVDCSDPQCVADAGADCDGDGEPNGTDCAPDDPTAMVTPPPIDDLTVVRWLGARLIRVSWTDFAGTTGTGTRYEVASDSLGALWTTHAVGAPCIATDLDEPALVDARATVGSGWYFVARGRNACGPARGDGWGSSSEGLARSACP